MDKSLYLKEFEMELTEDQFETVAKHWDEVAQSGKKLGMLAIQPATFVKDREPGIKVTIFTEEFTKKLGDFISEEAAKAKFGLLEGPADSKN